MYGNKIRMTANSNKKQSKQEDIGATAFKVQEERTCQHRIPY